MHDVLKGDYGAFSCPPLSPPTPPFHPYCSPISLPYSCLSPFLADWSFNLLIYTTDSDDHNKEGLCVHTIVCKRKKQSCHTETNDIPYVHSSILPRVLAKIYPKIVSIETSIIFIVWTCLLAGSVVVFGRHLLTMQYSFSILCVVYFCFCICVFLLVLKVRDLLYKPSKSYVSMRFPLSLSSVLACSATTEHDMATQLLFLSPINVGTPCSCINQSINQSNLFPNAKTVHTANM